MTITPNRAKTMRKQIKEMIGELRLDIAEIRRLRALAADESRSAGRRQLSGEEAAAWLVSLRLDHQQLQDLIRRLRTADVVKYSNVSPDAANRLMRNR